MREHVGPGALVEGHHLPGHQRLPLLLLRGERVDAVAQLAARRGGALPGFSQAHLGAAGQAHVAALAGEGVAQNVAADLKPAET